MISYKISRSTLSPAIHRKARNLFTLCLSLWVSSLSAAVSEFGVVIHQLDMGVPEMLEIKATGFTWVRTDFTWIAIEKTKGVYDFTRHDRFIQRLKEAGLKAVIILDYGNPLYVDPSDPPGTPGRANTDRFRDAYAMWSSEVVNRYKGNGIFWEQWNEPNIKSYWPPAADSKEYIALVKQAAQAIRAKSPDEILIGPATSDIDLAFIEDCLRGGMLDYWSAISVHPYRHTSPETVAHEYAKLRLLIDRYATPAKPISIICGEWGYSSIWKNFDETKQADHLTKMFNVNEQLSIPLTIWYDWRDDGADESTPGNRFGLMRFDRAADRTLVPKPAWYAAKEFLTNRTTTAPGNLRVWISKETQK